MRENTGRRTVTTTNLIKGASAEYVWTEADLVNIGIIDAYAEGHRQNALQADYVEEFGSPEVWEYELPGLRVVVLTHDGQVDTIFAVEDRDIARYHQAVREQRSMTIRYVKADGEVTRRRIEPTSVRLTKAGQVVVRAHDRRRDEGRSFRADRVTHTTLHRDHFVPQPSKEALVAASPLHRPAAGEFDPRPAEYDRLLPEAGPAHPGWNALV